MLLCSLLQAEPINSDNLLHGHKSSIKLEKPLFLCSSSQPVQVHLCFPQNESALPARISFAEILSPFEHYKASPAPGWNNSCVWALVAPFTGSCCLGLQEMVQSIHDHEYKVRGICMYWRQWLFMLECFSSVPFYCGKSSPEKNSSCVFLCDKPKPSQAWTPACHPHVACSFDVWCPALMPCAISGTCVSGLFPDSMNADQNRTKFLQWWLCVHSAHVCIQCLLCIYCGSRFQVVVKRARNKAWPLEELKRVGDWQCGG